MEYVNGGEVSNRRVLSWYYYQFKINKKWREKRMGKKDDKSSLYSCGGQGGT